MAVTFFKVPINAGVLGAIGPADTVRVMVRTNVPEGVITYAADNWIFASGAVFKFKGVPVEVDLPTKVGANPVDFEFELTVEITRSGERPQMYGPFYKPAPTSTADAPLADWVGTSSVPASWMTAATAQLSGIAAGAHDALRLAAMFAGAQSGIVNPGALTPYRAALAGGAVKIAAIGDSITEGTNAATFAGTYPSRLQASLRSLTATVGGAGYVAAMKTESAVVPALPVTAVGTVRMGGWGVGGRSLQLHDPTHHATYDAQVCDRVRVWYGKTDTLGGGLRVLIDGVDQGVVLSSNAASNSDGHYWDSPALTPGSHVVKVTASNAFVGILDGVEFFNGDGPASGIRVYNGGHYGYQASHFLTANMAMHWQHVAAIAPDLTVIYLGTNDLYAGVTTSAFLADMDAVIAKTTGPILLVGGYLRGEYGNDAVKQGVWAAMQTGLRARATGRVGYLDLAPHWPALLPDGSTDAGLMSDRVHPNDAGMTRIADVFTAALGYSADNSFVGSTGPAGVDGTDGADGAPGAAIGGLLTTKGDLAVRGAAIAERLPVGGDGSALVADSTQATGVRWTTARLLEGTGMPEGVVAAAVGARYIDTAATNGAIEWIKASGTGTTGWRVVHGDTGNRNLLSLLETDATASSILARRVGQMVTLSMQGVKSVDATTTGRRVFVTPEGFRPDTPIYFRTYWDLNGYATGTEVRWNTTMANGTGGDFYSVTFVTSNAWPTTLPGTPA